MHLFLWGGPLEDGRESFIPQWTAGTSIAVADLTNAAGVTDQNGATITLYAVWDGLSVDCCRKSVLHTDAGTERIYHRQ